MASLALLKAVSAGRVRQVRLLLDSGSCCVNVADNCGQTPLMRAIFLDQEISRNKIVRMLLEKGALVNTPDVVGRNAFAWACLYGRYFNVEQLIDNADVDLDLNRTDINGQTPLFHSVSSGSASTVKLLVETLLKYDLSVDVQDFHGTSPLMLAMKLNHDVCASILIRNGNAKVGLGMKYPEDFNRAEKWAVQTMRHRHGFSVPTKRTLFPPVSSSRTKGSMGQRNDLNHWPTSRLNLPSRSSDSGSSSEEDDSDIPSTNRSSIIDLYSLNPRDETLSYCMRFAPKFGIPPSILAVSPSLSTVANASSEDEVDDFSSPCQDAKKKVDSATCLNHLYNMVQDQLTISYRPTAHVPPPQPSAKQLTNSTLITERSDVSSKSTRKGQLKLIYQS